MNHIGTASNGSALFSQVENKVRCYYLGDRLVAVATGNLEDVSMTQYACLDGIWASDWQTAIVDESELLRIAGKPVVSAA